VLPGWRLLLLIAELGDLPDTRSTGAEPAVIHFGLGAAHPDVWPAEGGEPLGPAAVAGGGRIRTGRGANLCHVSLGRWPPHLWP